MLNDVPRQAGENAIVFWSVSRAHEALSSAHRVPLAAGRKSDGKSSQGTATVDGDALARSIEVSRRLNGLPRPLDFRCIAGPGSLDNPAAQTEPPGSVTWR